MAKGFRLSDAQWEIFDLLARRTVVTKAAIRLALFGDRLDCDVPRTADKLIDVQISRMQQRLPLIGLSITVERPHDGPRGGRTARYRFAPPARAAARSLIAARVAS